MAKKKRSNGPAAWVWFFNGIGQKPAWVKGFRVVGEIGADPVAVEHDDYATRSLPAWRVSVGLAEPDHLAQSVLQLPGSTY